MANLSAERSLRKLKEEASAVENRKHRGGIVSWRNGDQYRSVSNEKLWRRFFFFLLATYNVASQLISLSTWRKYVS